jgi:hypothetical protein
MKLRLLLFLILFSSVVFCVFAQRATEYGDGAMAQQYSQWVQKEIDEGRLNEALAGLERAKDFANVSSDISYQLAFVRSALGKSRTSVIEALDYAVQVNRWVNYSSSDATLFKINQLIAMRKYADALSILDYDNIIATSADWLRLLALKGLAYGGNINALARFRSLVLITMDRYPADHAPFVVFFDYARSKKPADISESDRSLLELVLKRLPFILEVEPELAWMAAPFIKDTAEARRYVSAYRSGGLHRSPPEYSSTARDFRPHPASIPAALNLGLLADREAVEELFSGTRGINYPLPDGFIPVTNGDPILERKIIEDVFKMLGSDEGKDLFMQKLLSFTGMIISDDDNDGIVDHYTVYNSGVISEYAYDRNQENIFDLRIGFSGEGSPVLGEIPITGVKTPARVQWDNSVTGSRYPSVKQITLGKEDFMFRPAEFQYAPLELIILGGSVNYSGLAYPVPMYQYIELTRRSMVSFAWVLNRPSEEFSGAVERIFFERGIPRQAVEVLEGNNVSITEFMNGLPYIQYIDLDADGRMETVRRFKKPEPGQATELYYEIVNYLSLVESSQSDWTGEGVFKTGEAYLPDGSVVYSWDMDGSGSMNYSEIGNE